MSAAAPLTYPTHLFDRILGPALVGTLLNYLLCGIVLVQFYNYFRAGYRDTYLIKALVFLLLFVDLYHTSTLGYLMWYLTVTHFGDVPAAYAPIWPFNQTPILSGVCSTTVQMFLAWRIFSLTKSKVLYGFVMLVSLFNGLSAVGASVGTFVIKNVKDFPKLDTIAACWFAAQVVCDTLITVILCVYLSRNRTGFRHTDTVINRLMRSAVESALFATVGILFQLALFYGFPGTNLHLIFGLPAGRIYTNTMLATLNSRASQRDALNQKTGTPASWGAASTFIGASATGKSAGRTTVNVTVQRDRDIELDSMPDETKTTVFEGTYGTGTIMRSEGHL